MSDTASAVSDTGLGPRSRVLFDDGWRFAQNDPPGTTGLAYADTKDWVLPSGNDLVAEQAERHARPAGNLGGDVAYVAPGFDDSGWRSVTLPHDYAIEGPYTDAVPANMGHLPAMGVAWYRKTFSLPAAAAEKSVFIDFDGAMSYSLVWINGRFVGGWPYGYSSYRLDITPFIKAGEENVIAVRLDNPVPTGTAWNQGSSRWYPGAGLYRDVWLIETENVHVGHWGTYVRTPEVTATEAAVALDVTVDNDSGMPVTASVTTEIFGVGIDGERGETPVATIDAATLEIAAGASATAATRGRITNPKRWGPPPTQTPNLYDAVTTVTVDGRIVDRYPTRFGVRTFEYSAERGLIVNGEHVEIHGVCMHDDLGALGTAAYPSGKQRQLEILAGMGANAVRTAHNPEAPVLYDLADSMGFLIMDEAFDVWDRQKTGLDYHLLFDDWHEQDLRAMIRRDRNHPSVFIWSIGNEIPQQTDPNAGPLAASVRAIANAEDPTRPTISGMNSARPGSAFTDAMQTVGLNYQGSGVRGAPAGYPIFHAAYPDRFIVGTETTSTFSSRGVYTFPVAGPAGMTAGLDGGGMTADGQVSSYDLYHAAWSYVPDLEFANLDKWAYVAGEFVWTGFDYLGEPDPHSRTGARSSYFGIVDLAGFPKDRYYLYQAHWRPDMPMVHILPHWNWPGREGETTPIMVYTTGDSAEVYINGRLIGKKVKGPTDYRLRWDDAVYEPGTVRVVAYRDGDVWAEETMETAGPAAAISLEADRNGIAADGRALAFVTAHVVDAEGRLVPTADNAIHFSVSGPGELVATDNGDPMDRVVFGSANRDAFNGLALGIVRAEPGRPGQFTLTAEADGLTAGTLVVTTR